MKDEINDLPLQKGLRRGRDSLILGLSGSVMHLLAFLTADHFFIFEFFALFFGVSGLVLGIISRKKVKENNRLGLAGLILSILILAGCVLATVYFAVVLSRISDAISAVAGNPW